MNCSRFFTRILSTGKLIVGGPEKAIRDGCRWIIYEKVNPSCGIFYWQYYFCPRKLKAYRDQNYTEHRLFRTLRDGTLAIGRIVPIHDVLHIAERIEPSLEWYVSEWYDLLPLSWQLRFNVLMLESEWKTASWVFLLNEFLKEHGHDNIWNFLGDSALMNAGA